MCSAACLPILNQNRSTANRLQGIVKTRARMKRDFEALRAQAKPLRDQERQRFIQGYMEEKAIIDDLISQISCKP
jgi:hypothetical protein